MHLAHVILALILLVDCLASQVSADRALMEYDYDQDDCEDCVTWDFDWYTNTKWVGGTSAGTVTAASADDCANLCSDDDACATFNFYRRKCYKIREADLSPKSIKGYVAGYTYCADKKKK